MLRAYRLLLTGLVTALALASCTGGGSLPLPASPPIGAPNAVHPASGVGTTIPYFTSSFPYRKVYYTYSMVGTNPNSAGATTTIPVAIVPVRFAFGNGIVLDATRLVPYVVKSPLFTAGSFMGERMQFGDAVMRGEFWKYAQNKKYHVLLSAAATEPAVTISVPSADGYTGTSAGAVNGYVTFAWFVQTIEPQIIAQLKIPPTQLTIFVTRDTDVLEPGGHCCYRGYHETFTQSTASGTATWTTAWASVTHTDIEALSHEVAEWLNDPFYNNAVPAWIQPQTNVCGGSLLEVGDPVTNYAVRVNGFRLQDIAFYSWFTRQKRSIGFKERYDLLGRLRSPALNCT